MGPDKTNEKSTRQNRVREALGRIYDNYPPYFREYLRRYQDDPTSRVFAPLAEAYRRLGHVDDAIEICKQGLDHHPEFHGGRVTYAKCLIDKRRHEEARAELERVIQYVPENLLAQRLLGDVCLTLKDAPASLHAYRMALLLSPSDVALAERVHTMEKELAKGELAIPLKPLAQVETAPPLAEPPSLENAEATPTAAVEVSPREPEIPVVAPVSPASDDSVSVEIPQTANATTGIEALFSEDDPDDDAFKIEHVSAIFHESQPKRHKEITTETLGDLYFTQGQFDKSLRIFEKLHERNPSAELTRKVNACRIKLGVGQETILRNRKIEVLREVLRKVHE